MRKLPYKFYLNNTIIMAILTFLAIRYCFANNLIDPELFLPKDDSFPRSGLTIGFIIVGAITTLISIIVPFIDSSKFRPIKIYSRLEKNTSEFTKGFISIALAPMVGICGILESLITGDIRYMDIGIAIAIVCMIIARLLYKEEGTLEIHLFKKEGVEVSPFESYIPLTPQEIETPAAPKIEMPADVIEEEKKSELSSTDIPVVKKIEKTAYKQDLELASMASRIPAAIVDFIIVTCIVSLDLFIILMITLLIVDPNSKLGESETDALLTRTAIPLFFVLMIVTAWLYYALFESSRSSATPGKMIFKIRVTDCDGNRISFKRASIRIIWKHLMFMLSIFIIPVYAFVMAGMNDKRQALHDIMAKTLVKKGIAG